MNMKKSDLGYSNGDVTNYYEGNSERLNIECLQSKA